MKSIRRFSFSTIMIYAVLIIVSLSSIYPFFYMIMNAFKSNDEYNVNPNGFTQHWTLSSIQMMLKSTDLLVSFKNSIFVVTTAVILTTVIASMAGYSLSKLKFPGQKYVFLGIISCMMIPFQVIIVPLYVSMSNLGFTGSYWLVILIYVTTSLPFGVYLMRSFFMGIPGELLEAAQIDALSYHKIFYRIMLPLGKPALVSLSVLNFMGLWNDLLISLIFLQDPTKRTVNVNVSLLVSKHVTNYPTLFAGLLFSSIPTILFFVLFQKYLTKGVTVGISK